MNILHFNNTTNTPTPPHTKKNVMPVHLTHSGIYTLCHAGKGCQHCITCIKHCQMGHWSYWDNCYIFWRYWSAKYIWSCALQVQVCFIIIIFPFFFLLTHTVECVCIHIYRIFLLVLDLCHYLIVWRVFIVWSFSYPPPREKCAAPNCTNSYKYRDSKSKLPLCSLHCYRAIHQKMQPLIAC